MIVVLGDSPAQRDHWLRRPAAIPGARTLEAADQEADRRINQLVLAVVGCAAVPAHVNWTLVAGLTTVGIIRIARAYGVSLTTRDAWKLLVQLVLSGGYWFVSATLGGKALTALLQTTGLGYVAGWTMDVALSCAEAYAIGMTAKAYFRGEKNSTKLGEILRTSFSQARQRLRPDELRRLRAEARLVLADYDGLRDVLQSTEGRSALSRILERHADIEQHLTAFMQKHRIARLGDITNEQLRLMDEQSGLAQRLWTLLIDDAERAASRQQSIERDLRRLKGTKVDLQVLSRHEAADLVFPAGHPIEGVVYIAHPFADRIFFPAAQYHRLLFEHKRNEAVRFVEGLGATKIECHDVHGSSQVGRGKAGLSHKLRFPGLGRDASVNVAGSGGASTRDKRRFTVTYADPGTGAAELPMDLVWLPHEPDWLTLERGSRAGRLRSFELEVRHAQDFGVNAGLVARLGLGQAVAPGASATVEVGLSLGGQFERHRWSALLIKGEFSPAP